jgi:hypothetical protein
MEVDKVTKRECMTTSTTCRLVTKAYREKKLSVESVDTVAFQEEKSSPNVSS